MKNSPDEWLNKVSHRLREYTEEPDADTWEKIVGGLGNDREAAWIPWVNRTGVLIGMLAFSWLLFTRSGHFNVPVTQATATSMIASIENSAADRVVEHKKLNSQPGKVSSASTRTGVTHATTTAANGSDTRRVKTTVSSLYQKYSVVTRPATTENTNEHASNEVLETKIESVTGNASVMPSPSIAPIDINEAETEKEADLQDEKTMKPDSIRYAAIEKSKKTPRRYTFYVSVTPMLTYQKVSPFRGDRLVISKFADRPVISINRLGSSLDAGIQGPLKGKVEYYTGMHLYAQSQTLAYDVKNGQYYYAGDQALSYSVNPIYTRKLVTYDMLNAGLQAGVLYHLKGEKLKQKIGAGITFEKGFRTNGESYNNTNSRYGFYQIFYRNEYAWQRSVSLFVQPVFSYAVFSNESLEEPFKLKPYRAGITFGLVYGVNR